MSKLEQTEEPLSDDGASYSLLGIEELKLLIENIECTNNIKFITFLIGYMDLLVFIMKQEFMQVLFYSFWVQLRSRQAQTVIRKRTWGNWYLIVVGNNQLQNCNNI